MREECICIGSSFRHVHTPLILGLVDYHPRMAVLTLELVEEPCAIDEAAFNRTVGFFDPDKPRIFGVPLYLLHIKKLTGYLLWLLTCFEIFVLVDFCSLGTQCNSPISFSCLWELVSYKDLRHEGVVSDSLHFFLLNGVGVASRQHLK